MGQDRTADATTHDNVQSEARLAKTGLGARLMEMARETAPLMNDGRSSKDLMDELYDGETGLPK
jgi:hypothetical protein